MTQHKPDPHHQHQHHHVPYHKRAHKDWRMWLVVLLMLGAMFMYVMSDNETIKPGGGTQPAMPAAP